MALVRACIPATDARLMGRWKSWTMLQYLHKSALDTSTYASRMLTGGNFVIPKHQFLPADALSILGPILDDPTQGL